MEFNLADLFECVADSVPDREALVCAGRRLTYRSLDERATRLAHGLANAGVGRGDHVGLFLHNCFEYLEAMLAAYKLRAVPVNVNYRYVGSELAYVLDDADVVALLYHEELSPVVDSVPYLPMTLRAEVVVEDSSGIEPAQRGALAYEDVLASGGPARDFPPRSADDHYILYTGGTTGLPKGVVWRHEDILFATLGGGNAGRAPIRRPEEIASAVRTNRAQRAAPFLRPGQDEPERFTVLALGPLMHASGQWSALSTLLGGGRVVVYPHRHMDMDLVLDLIAAESVTMVTLIGDASGRPLLDAIRSRPDPPDTSSVLLLGSGGSILSPEVKDGLLEAMPSVLAISEAIGSSEAPVQGVAIARPADGPSASLRFDARDLTMVVDDELRRLEPGSGKVGRLATRGHVPLGYYKDPGKSAQTFVEIDGTRWTLPGDMATVEADGSIRLLGRGSMCINTGGEKVYPEEVEAALKAHASVADAVVVGAPDPRWGERVAAVVQPSGDRPLTLGELQDHCRDRLAGYKIPRALHLVAEVRRSPSGKPDYPWAQEVARAEMPASSSAEPVEEAGLG